MASLDSSETQSDAVNELITSAESVCSNRIDLSRRKISEIPDPLFELSRLEHLYLEGNHLTSIPDSLFEKLSNLKWLDLRNNKLHELPASVGKHRALRSLLLEGNEIKELPPELGMVRTLTAIHLADNPLEFPPKNIVQKGTQEILKFLREQIPQEEAEVSPGLTDDEKPEPEQGKAKSGKERTLSPSDSSEEDEIYPPLPPMNWSIPKTLSDDSGKELTRNKDTSLHRAPISGSKLRPSGELKQTKPDVKKNSNPISAPKKKIMSPNSGKTLVSASNNNVISQEKSMKQKNISNGKLRKKKEKPKLLDEIRFNRDTSFEMMEQVKQKSKEQLLKGPEIHALLKEEATQAEKPHRKIKFDPASLQKGDMVALRMPIKHFIPGQPCLGQIANPPDTSGFVLVHYYTGTYGGPWRPMMSRSSPYLRRVPVGIVACTFELNKDKTMTPETIASVKEAVGEM